MDIKLLLPLRAQGEPRLLLQDAQKAYDWYETDVTM